MVSWEAALRMAFLFLEDICGQVMTQVEERGKRKSFWPSALKLKLRTNVHRWIFSNSLTWITVKEESSLCRWKGLSSNSPWLSQIISCMFLRFHFWTAILFGQTFMGRPAMTFWVRCGSVPWTLATMLRLEAVCLVQINMSHFAFKKAYVPLVKTFLTNKKTIRPLY